MTDMSSPPSLPPPGTERRIMAIWLPRLAIDRWRHAEGCATGAGADAGPVALVAETAHGPRIETANDSGLAAGARSGMRLADARALCPGLKVAASDPVGDLAFLEALALWAQRWGPWSALDVYPERLPQAGSRRAPDFPVYLTNALRRDIPCASPSPPIAACGHGL